MGRWYRPRTFVVIGSPLFIAGTVIFWKANHVSLQWGFAGALMLAVGFLALFFGVDLWFRGSKDFPSLIGLDDD